MNETGDRNEFSTWIFFPDGTYMPSVRWVSALDAIKAAKKETDKPAAGIGIITKVIVTDGGDFTVFQWEHGKGIVYPTPEMREAHHEQKTVL